MPATKELTWRQKLILLPCVAVGLWFVGGAFGFLVEKGIEARAEMDLCLKHAVNGYQIRECERSPSSALRDFGPQ